MSNKRKAYLLYLVTTRILNRIRKYRAGLLPLKEVLNDPKVFSKRLKKHYFRALLNKIK